MCSTGRSNLPLVDLTYRDQDTPVVTFDEEWQNNRQKIKVTVLKKEKDTERMLEGAIFGLFTKEDIKGRDGKVLMEAGTLIEQKTTDENGQILFKADLPVDGTYIVKEIYVMVMGSMIEQLMGMGPETILKDESVQNIAEVISNGMGSENPMFIVTNSQTVGGAGVIFYPEVMDQIGEGFQGNFFILPSSTHETLVIPDNGAFDYRVLEDMVQTINENEVAPEERLSDHVYHYDVKDRVFERADKFEERQKEKAAQLDKNEYTGKEQSMKQPKAKKHEMEL